MNPLTPTPLTTPSADEDLAEQALPGHGIPSQDPDPAAQTALEPQEAERESHSVLVGGGVVVGAATGAALGVVAAGPLGAVLGTAVGAVAGALGGAAAGSAAAPENQSSGHILPSPGSRFP